MYALLILDMQVGLLHGPEKSRAAEALLDTLIKLLSKARSAGAPNFSPAMLAHWVANRAWKPVDTLGVETGGRRRRSDFREKPAQRF